MEILVISFIAGLICFIMPKRVSVLTAFVAVLSSMACLAFSVKLFMDKQFSYSGALIQVKDFLVNNELFKINTLNVFITGFICFFAFLVILYSLGYIKTQVKRPGEYYAYILWTVCVSCGAVLANNILLFMFMWGAGAFFLYQLIGIQSSDEASAAAKKTLIIVGGSDAFMILGVAILWHITGSFNMDKMRIAVLNKASIAAFFCLIIGAMAKAGAIPFHTWIPDSSTAAPQPVMAVLPASLDKLLGIYLLTRCTWDIFVIEKNSYLSILLMVIGAVTIIGAVMMALMQRNFKRFLAYSTVSQVGYMVLGIGSATTLGIAGGLFHMLNHAIYKTCLFLAGANVEHRTGESEFDKMGGLAHLMPVTFAAFLIASLSISGVPPFSGFFSKWMIYQGLIQSLAEPRGHYIVFLCLMAAMFGSALTLASFMKCLHAMFLGQPTAEISKAKIKEVPFNMWLVPAVLALLSIVFGVFANQLPLKYFIYPAVGEIAGLGNYAPVFSAVLIFLGLTAGLIFYFMAGINRLARRDASFIGAETLPVDNKVSGIDFYANVNELHIFKGIYARAEHGFFDVFEQGKNFVITIGKFFQYLHNGVMPTYIVWMLLGMIVLFFKLMMR